MISRVKLDRLGADVHAEPAIGDGRPIDDLRLGPCFGLGGDEMVHRQHEFGAREGQDMPGDVELVGLDLALADLVPLGLQEGVGHRSADQELVDLLEQVLDDQDLVGDLGPAHHGHVRALGLRQQGVENMKLLLDQEPDAPGPRGELFGHGDHRGLVAMAGAEGIVDVSVGQAAISLANADIALLLALVEPDVFEHDDPARCEGLEAAWASGPTVSVSLLDGSADQLFEPGRHLVHPERRVSGRVASRPAQVADQDQASAPLEDVI